MNNDCLFCGIQTIDRKRVIAENDLAYAIRDGFEVTVGHTLLIPKRHTKDYFGLTQAEVNAINTLMADQKNNLSLPCPFDSKTKG
jgi:diadenosine tetraphosphate (Ap4A) HIT family hydrolase